MRVMAHAPHQRHVFLSRWSQLNGSSKIDLPEMA